MIVRRPHHDAHPSFHISRSAVQTLLSRLVKRAVPEYHAAHCRIHPPIGSNIFCCVHCTRSDHLCESHGRIPRMPQRVPVCHCERFLLLHVFPHVLTDCSHCSSPSLSSHPRLIAPLDVFGSRVHKRQGMVFLLIVMRISSSANTASRYGSMFSLAGGSALSLSTALSGEKKRDIDIEQDGGGRNGEQKDRWRTSTPIAIHVSVSTLSDYEEVSVHSPESPPVSMPAQQDAALLRSSGKYPINSQVRS